MDLHSRQIHVQVGLIYVGRVYGYLHCWHIDLHVWCDRIRLFGRPAPSKEQRTEYEYRCQSIKQNLHLWRPLRAWNLDPVYQTVPSMSSDKVWICHTQKGLPFERPLSTLSVVDVYDECCSRTEAVVAAEEYPYDGDS